MLRSLEFAGALIIGTWVFISCSAASPDVVETQALDQVLASIQKNWHPTHNCQGSRVINVEARFELDRAGNISGKPQIRVHGSKNIERPLYASEAERAVTQSAPFRMLPADRYEAWHTMIVKFENCVRR